MSQSAENPDPAGLNPGQRACQGRAPARGSDPVAVGFVGLGHNGLAHLRAHLEGGRSRVVALCDRNPQRLAAAAALAPGARTYRGDEFYGDPEIEAVSIHTGDDDHRDPFVRAVEAGRHVLVEKPLANSEADVAAMVAAADAADPDLRIQVGYILRFNPVFEAIQRLSRAGDLGQVYYMEGDYIHNLLYQAGQTDPATGHNWYLEREIPMVGGGSHPLDLLRWFSGAEVVRVSAYGTHVAFPAMHCDDCQVALFQFDSGAVAKVAALYAPRTGMAPFYNLRVYGTMGTVERDQVALADSPEDVHPEFGPVAADRLSGHPYEPEIADWLEAIRDDRAPRTTLWDGANSTAAALVAARALREGRALEVPVYRPPEAQ